MRVFIDWKVRKKREEGERREEIGGVGNGWGVQRVIGYTQWKRAREFGRSWIGG